ncbi:MAG: PQQ-binding-like beta-propeller repeat protein [Candidatus Thermoplasmatota archaeon]|nr:PQQ-binding-like beta-propeller repeat protein [Candidatus Thermoplasmatota archaeon]
MNKKIIGIFVCMLLIVTTLATIGMANEKQVSQNINISENTEHSWPMFHYDLCRNGFSPSSAPNTNNMIWSFEIPGKKEPIDASPVIDNGKVYIGSHNANFYCLNAANGDIIWTQVLGNGIYSASSIVNNRVYLTADPGFVYCLDAITGDVLWNYETNANYMDSSPAVVDGKVYVGAGSNDGQVYCLDASNGDEIWKYQTGDKIYSSPTYFDGKVYIGSFDKKVYCLNASNGNKIWSFTMEGSCFLSSPAYFDEKIYIGSYDKNLYCLDALTGNKLWNFTTGAKVESSPAIAYGKVFFGSFDKYVYCLDAITGSKIWNFKTNNTVYSSPAVADGKLYFGSFDKNFYCLNSTTGSLIWNYITNGYVSSSPAIADRALYIGGVVNGRIYCFKDKVNKPPEKPTITGESSGKPGTEYEYKFVSTDPEGDNIEYCIDWGDNTSEVCIGPYVSGVEASAKHTWSEKGDYAIKVKAKDTIGAESDWEILIVSMPKSKTINIPLFLQSFFQRFTFFEKILKQYY